MPSHCNREYEITFRDAFGNFLFHLQGEYSARWVLREGQPGAATFELPVRKCNVPRFALTQFNEDTRVEIWRKTDGVKTLVGEAPFFLSYIASKQDANGERVIYLEFESALGLLERHLNPYDGEDPRAALLPLPCDDQMKFLVRNNFLGSAGQYLLDPDPLRDLSAYIQVQPDSSSVLALYQGQTQNQSILNLLDRIQKYAFSKQEPLFYHLVQVQDFGNPFLEFRTYLNQRGTDRTLATGGANARIISPENGTITEYEFSYNWKETASRVYGGGRGQGSSRDHVVADDPDLAARLAVTPFALREQFANISTTDQNIDIQVETDAALQAALANVQVTGTLGESSAYVYGRDWFWGDRVTAQIDGVAVDVYLESEECSLMNGGEELTVGFSNNLQKRLTGLGGILQRLRRTELKVDYLNSVDYA